MERARVGQGCADACPDKYGKYCNGAETVVLKQNKNQHSLWLHDGTEAGFGSHKL